MKKFFSKKLLIAALFLLIGLSFSSPALAAGTYDVNAFKEKSGLNATAEVGGYETSHTDLPEMIIGRMVSTILGLIGVVFISLVIYGGFTWMTAQGNEEKAKKAMGILMNALLGVVITLAAYVISYFILTSFVG